MPYEANGWAHDTRAHVGELQGEASGAGWGPLSRHGLAILALATRPDLSRDGLASLLGVTGRHVTNILRDLRDAGVVHVHRSGRRSHYAVNFEAPLRLSAPSPLPDTITVRRFIRAFLDAAVQGH